MVQSWALWGDSYGTFTAVGGHPMLVVDNFATFLNITFLLTGLLSILISAGYLRKHELDRPEFYMLMLFSLSGMMLMGMANDLILIFMGLEAAVHPPLHHGRAGLAAGGVGRERHEVLRAGRVLVGHPGLRHRPGLRGDGTTALPGIVAAVAAAGEVTLLLVAGAALILVGFAFKIAAVPFHMWTPDVYEGAPTVVTAFMSVGSKVGGFAALLRILIVALPALGETWTTAISVMAALTLIVGNLLAIVQPNIKRMLGLQQHRPRRLHPHRRGRQRA
jgi:NADH-quinone oxidoreductase subunit N